MSAGVAGVLTPPLVYIKNGLRTCHLRAHGPTPPLKTPATPAKLFINAQASAGWPGFSMTTRGEPRTRSTPAKLFINAQAGIHAHVTNERGHRMAHPSDSGRLSCSRCWTATGSRTTQKRSNPCTDQSTKPGSIHPRLRTGPRCPVRQGTPRTLSITGDRYPDLSLVIASLY